MSVRTAAAIAVVAGVVTTLLPLSATAASAADDQAVLRTEMSAPVPGGPLTRGGATEAFELTVRNLTGKPVEYKPWMPVEQTGPSPLQADDITFEVEAVNAPTTGFSVGRQDGGWQGLFYPAASGRSGHGFDIPANGKMTWKVTIGLGAKYPTNDGDFKLTAAPSNSQASGAGASRVFKVDPQIKTGELKTWIEQGPSGKDDPEHLAYLNLNYRATGEGTFDEALDTALTLSHPGNEAAEFQIQALIDGRWQHLTGDYGRYRLPRIPQGFGAASGVRTQPLRVSLGTNTKLTKKTEITVNAEVSLAKGNTHPFNGASLKFPLAPIGDPGPAPTSAPKPSTTPSADPTGKAPASAAPVRQAVAPAGNTSLTTTTGSATGSLASTGSSGTGPYAGLAAALVALGAGAAWLGARRRRGTSA
ncbi:hypothetical protein ACFTWH_20280 [Streptomyces sp. NPDC057011]|uniref:hypothetical protein n=1 Tax=unclassified Streptomyces TaxID=2593676 RepID=UPI003636AF10